MLYQPYRKRQFRLFSPLAIGDEQLVYRFAHSEPAMQDKSIVAISVTLLTLIGLAAFQFYTLAWAVRL